MRLREMKERLIELNNSYEIEVKPVSNTTTSRIISPLEINNAITEIANFGFIDNEVEELNEKYEYIFSNRDVEITISTNSANGYLKLINNIDLKVSAVISAISYALEEQKDNLISVKLPPYADLKKVAKFIHDTDNVIRTVLPPNKQSEIKLNNFDTGSNWFEFFLNEPEQVLIIAEFIKHTAIFAKNHLVSNLSTRRDIEKSDLTDEVKKVMLQGMKDMREQNAKLCVAELLESGKIDTSEISSIEEYKNGLSVQMLRMGEYITEGAEIRPALNAPPEVKAEFPNVEEYKQLQRSVTQLLIETSIDSENEVEEIDIE